MTRDEVIEFYRTVLKRKFNMYGLEVVLAADLVSEKYNPTRGEFAPFAKTVLRNTISKCRRKEEYHYQLSETWDAPDVTPTEDYILARMDIVAACGERNYSVYYDSAVKGFPVRTVAEIHDLSPMNVRTIVSKVEKFLEENYGH